MKLVAFLILSFLPALLAQPATPKDVAGWNSTRWGMTTTEAKAVSPEMISVGDVDLKVYFYEDDSKIVQKIELSKIFLKAGRDRAFETLKAALLGKYGHPSSEDTISGVSTAIWVFPSTWITLQTAGTAVVEIIYQPADKKAKNLL